MRARLKSLREPTIKGGIVELLIREFFYSSNYDVYDLGFEKIAPKAAKLLHHSIASPCEVNEDMAVALRRMADFIIQDPSTGQIRLVEVKYRTSSTFNFSEIWRYPKTSLFVFVTPEYVQCFTYDELNSNRKVHPDRGAELYKRNDLFRLIHFASAKAICEQICYISRRLLTSLECFDEVS